MLKSPPGPDPLPGSGAVEKVVGTVARSLMGLRDHQEEPLQVLEEDFSLLMRSVLKLLLTPR